MATSKLRHHIKQDMISPGLYPGPGIYVGPGFCPKFYDTLNVIKLLTLIRTFYVKFWQFTNSS